MKQRTLSKTYSFEGKGLHTGRRCHMLLCPAPADTGIRFQRTDLGPAAFVDAVATNVTSTRRSTLISNGKASVRTIEHLLSALTGLGIDNVLVQIDGPEVPIFDGSARTYIEAMAADTPVEQAAERRWIELDHEITVEGRHGSVIRITPADTLSVEVTVDFNSHVLGVQKSHWSLGDDYATQVAPCRTFCFFDEIYRLALFGMVKGGDVNNAIIVVENPVSERKMKLMARIFKQPFLKATPEGYLSNLQLRFPDECGRHKLLDLIGDFRLCGGFLKAHIDAYKPGHTLNTQTAKQIIK